MSYVWSASYDCSVKLWRLVDSVCLVVLAGHQDPVRSLDVRGGWVVSGDYRGFVMIWDEGEVMAWVNREARKREKSRGHMEGLYCLRGGRLMRRNREVPDYQQHVSFLDHRGHVTSISLGPGIAVTGSRDRTLNIHNFWEGMMNTTKYSRKSYF